MLGVHEVEEEAHGEDGAGVAIALGARGVDAEGLGLLAQVDLRLVIQHELRPDDLHQDGPGRQALRAQPELLHALGRGALRLGEWGGGAERDGQRRRT